VAAVITIGLSFWIWRLYRTRYRAATLPPSDNQVPYGQKSELDASKPPEEIHAQSLPIELPVERPIELPVER